MKRFKIQTIQKDSKHLKIFCLYHCIADLHGLGFRLDLPSREKCHLLPFVLESQASIQKVQKE